MTTTQIVWIVVIAVVALVLIGLIVGSIRKKNAPRPTATAPHSCESAPTPVPPGLPDAEARADHAEAEAERAHLAAQRADEHAATARAEADQERAIQEDRIRAADRLDPDVDNTADDYAPEVVTPAGPASDPSVVDPDTIFDRDDAAPATTTSAPSAPEPTPQAPEPTPQAPEPTPQAASPSGGSSVTLEPVDTTTHDGSYGDDDRLARRLNGHETTEGDDDAPSGGTTGPDDHVRDHTARGRRRHRHRRGREGSGALLQEGPAQDRGLRGGDGAAAGAARAPAVLDPVARA